ncbi:MAG TPA: type II toxin-antitoxin system VapC family toxin, partial [Terriglobales bacterium]|nr:type II toxin-antitoxin system VapC family toxin [Terriglobales bacterium]
MRLLLDSSALIWWFAASPLLSPRAQRSVKDSRNQIFVSAASIWEIGIKQQMGKLEAAAILEQVPLWLVQERFVELPISALHA